MVRPVSRCLGGVHVRVHDVCVGMFVRGVRRVCGGRCGLVCWGAARRAVFVPWGWPLVLPSHAVCSLHEEGCMCVTVGVPCVRVPSLCGSCACTVVCEQGAGTPRGALRMSRGPVRLSLSVGCPLFHAYASTFVGCRAGR